MIDRSPQKQLDDLNKEIEKKFESIGKSISERQADIGKSITERQADVGKSITEKQIDIGKSIVKKYNQIERPIQDELDRIDSELHDVSIVGDDIGVHIPFGRIMPGGGGLDFTIVSLGYKCDPDNDNPDEVRIYAGEIDRIAVAQTDCHPIGNDNYVYVARTIADDTMDVLFGTDVPADSATYKYYRLYRFTVAGGIVTIQNIYRPFDIEEKLPYGGTDGQLLQRDASLNAVWGWGRMKTI